MATRHFLHFVCLLCIGLHDCTGIFFFSGKFTYIFTLESLTEFISMMHLDIQDFGSLVSCVSVLNEKIWIWIPYPLGKWVDLFWILWNHKGTAMQRNSWMKRLILITTEFWNCIVRENLNHYKSLCRQHCPSNVEIQSDSAFYTCGLGCPSPDFGYLFHSWVCGLWHGPAIMLARWTYSVSPIRLWRKDWVVPGLYV